MHSAAWSVIGKKNGGPGPSPAHIVAGKSREFIQELRGDVRREAIDLSNHIDKKELRECYLAHIPQLGI